MRVFSSEQASSFFPNDLFLAEPAPLAELDLWIEDYLHRQSRFTFTEEEVLKALWDEGEEIRLREDSRFRETRLTQQVAASQWHLAHHEVANQTLYEMLADELWDGNDLLGFLAWLDQRSSPHAFHVFALGDERFLVTQERQGIFHLALHVAEEPANLPHEEKALLEEIASHLLERYPDLGSEPCTTRQVFEAIKTLAGQSSVLEALPLAAVTERLMQQEEWVRVGEETWIRRDHLPTISPRHRYAMLPVASPAGVVGPALPQLISENSSALETPQPPEAAKTASPTSLPDDQRSWHVVLRTVHLNDGYIPVPSKVHSLYPHARRLANPIVLSGLWVDDRSSLTLWLDRTRHELFGSDLQDQFSFLEAGALLQVTWQAAGLIFQVVGADTQVAEEESRLVDLTSLAHLRSTLLESYRASLRALFIEHGQALSFQELYQALCQRQQHTPNSATIRTILSSSPEFEYLKSARKWSLNVLTTSEVGARALRRSVLVAQEEPEGEGMVRAVSTPHSLVEMIAKQRHDLQALRSRYFIGENQFLKK